METQHLAQNLDPEVTPGTPPGRGRTHHSAAPSARPGLRERQPVAAPSALERGSRSSPTTRSSTLRPVLMIAGICAGGPRQRLHGRRRIPTRRTPRSSVGRALGKDTSAPSFAMPCALARISKEDGSEVAFPSTANQRFAGSGEPRETPPSSAAANPELYASHRAYFDILAARPQCRT
jgi:hypothetical protein